MNKEQEENVGSFTRDIKNFLRQKDYESAIILLDDLTKYVRLLKMDHGNKKESK